MVSTSGQDWPLSQPLRELQKDRNADAERDQLQVMLIGLMSLPNQNAYIQFHPVVYTAKLNIEMSSKFCLSDLKYCLFTVKGP